MNAPDLARLFIVILARRGGDHRRRRWWYFRRARWARRLFGVGLVALAGLAILFLALMDARKRVDALDQRSGELAPRKA